MQTCPGMSSTERIYDELTWRCIEPYLPPTGLVLDAGSGTGKWAIPIAERGLKVVLLDISAGILEVARRKIQERGLEGRVSLVQGDIHEMDFPDRHFDFVLAEGVSNTAPTLGRHFGSWCGCSSRGASWWQAWTASTTSPGRWRTPGNWTRSLSYCRRGDTSMRMGSTATPLLRRISEPWPRRAASRYWSSSASPCSANIWAENKAVHPRGPRENRKAPGNRAFPVWKAIARRRRKPPTACGQKGGSLAPGRQKTGRRSPDRAKL